MRAKVGKKAGVFVFRPRTKSSDSGSHSVDYNHLPENEDVGKGEKWSNGHSHSNGSDLGVLDRHGHDGGVNDASRHMNQYTNGHVHSNGHAIDHVNSGSLVEGLGNFDLNSVPRTSNDTNGHSDHRVDGTNSVNGASSVPSTSPGASGTLREDPLAARFRNLRGPRPYPEPVTSVSPVVEPQTHAAGESTIPNSPYLDAESPHLPPPLLAPSSLSPPKPSISQSASSLSPPSKNTQLSVSTPASRSATPSLLGTPPPSYDPPPPPSPEPPIARVERPQAPTIQFTNKYNHHTPIIFPKTTIVTTSTLLKYLTHVPESILVLDIRDRASFDNGHISAPNIVCIEPVSLRKDMNDGALEDTLVIAPTKEQEAFNRRDSYELVVYYDSDSRSESYRGGPMPDPQSLSLYYLVSALYERAFSKPLKRPPCLLVGGFDAWWDQTNGRYISKSLTRNTDTNASQVQSDETDNDGIPPSPTVPQEIPSRPYGSRKGSIVSTHSFSRDVNDYIRSAPSLSDVSVDAYSSERPDYGPRRLSRESSGSRRESHTDLYNIQASAYHQTQQYQQHPQQYPRSPHSQSTQGPRQYQSNQQPQLQPQSQGLQQHLQQSPQRQHYQQGYQQGYQPYPQLPYQQPHAHSQSFAQPYSQAPPQTQPRRSSYAYNQYTPPPQSYSNGNGNNNNINPPTNASVIASPRPVVVYPYNSAEGPNSTPPMHHQSVSVPPSPGPPVNGYTRPVSSTSLMVSPRDIASKEFTTGLKNLGNTCYMNCIIQCLAGTPKLADVFADNSYKQFINVNSKLGYKGVLAQTFAALVQRMLQGKEGYVPPIALKDLAGRLRDTFQGYEQQDCQEFLTFILDGLHEELNSNGDKARMKELTEKEESYRERMSVRVASTIEWERYLKSDYSLIVDIAQGQYRSQLRCLTCGHTSTTFNSFSFLSLPIPLDKQNVTIQDCFDLFTAEEILDGDDAWHCSKCKKPRRTSKRLTIARFPPVLIIHLKRFQQRRGFIGNSVSNKLETPVMYPLTGLDMTGYWPNYTAGDEQTLDKLPLRGQTAPFIYDLYAVANHFGTLKGGHYTSFVNKGRKGWCYFDDTRVTCGVPKQNVVNRHGYVLFYERRPIIH
ncbi:Doa4p [Sugiyamaella lignohabitans]|uniref:ubiquitinyl hydrolase 1 n=1 Tax=Sugiyamaella lignohabitans TaxID=796027 RepID=A0A167F4G6_9ASCO|nr:Doa4p [Sugiyamaella lignohabitans]ANB14816.1 Doa4p [Sugiyamaella lignohabitans]